MRSQADFQSPFGLPRLISKKGEGTFSEVLKARLAFSECPAHRDYYHGQAQSIKSGKHVAIKCDMAAKVRFCVVFI